MPDLYTFGEAMALFLCLDSDDVADAQIFTRGPAGAEANVAVAISRLGLTSHFYTRLGADPLGTALLSDFAKESVDVSGIKRFPEPTGAMIRNPGTTRPVEAFYLRKGSAASKIGPEDIDRKVLRQSRWIHTTGIACAISRSTADAVKFALELSREFGKSQSLDLNIRRKLWSEDEARSVLEPLAQNLHLLVGGEDEFAVVFDSPNPRAALHTATERGCRIAVMTNGKGTIRYMIDGEYGEIEPPTVSAIDPVGSGDAFTGGLIGGLLGGLSPVDAIRQGSISGARVATHFGDWTGLPTGEEGRIDPVIISNLTGAAQ